MVVDEDDARGLATNGGCEQFADADDSSADIALAYGDVLQHRVLGAEQQDVQFLSLEAGHRDGQPVDDVAWGAHLPFAASSAEIDVSLAGRALEVWRLYVTQSR